MDKVVFYSWQSDLPNNKNRSFIQDCITQAVSNINEQQLHIDIAIDRDTKGAIGTPDISATIFSKIERANVFVGDVSFINPGASGRKTPNPNVLIELGFAAKCIGWEHIICIFNEEFGDIEELPFDLRFRRPMTYRIEKVENKSKDKRELSDRLQKAITEIIRKQSAKDEVKNYLKGIIDKEVLSICNHLFKIVYGYEDQLSSENIWPFLELSHQKLGDKMNLQEFIGFTVLKEWEGHLDHLNNTINQPFFVQHAHEEFITPLVKIIKALELVNSVTKNDGVFIDTKMPVAGYKVVSGREMNAANPPDHYILLKEIDGEKGIVKDFGEIKPYNFERLLFYQQQDKRYSNFVGCLHILLASLRLWVKATGNSFIIGPAS